MTKLLESLKFRDNPFANYSAENEPEIARYFVRPSYYEFVRERGFNGRSTILFGARGAGKSATRLAFAKDAWSPETLSKKPPLTVTLDDFSRVLSDGLGGAGLGKYIAEIGYLVTEGVLLSLATRPEDDRELILRTLTDQEEAMAILMVQRFYLSRPEFLREQSVREPLKLLRQSWHDRALLWVGSKWDSIAATVAGIAQGFASKALGGESRIESSLGTLLKADSKQWSDAQFARTLLTRFTDLSRIFGFSGITVLVDKVDETEATNNSASATARLLYPLLASTQLLEVDGFSWLFFLWDKVRDEYSEPELQVRLDKIANATISWDDAFLVEVIQNRLRHFSEGAINTFSEVCEAESDAATSLDEIVRMSTRSPRELIRIMDTIVREHDDEHAVNPHPPRLNRTSIDRGLDRYSIDVLRRTFNHMHLRQIAKLSRHTFLNADVQQVFRINVQSARNRILAWADAGIVSQTGTRQAEGGGAGKPAHEYSVTDFRVKRMLDRDLRLGAEFEVGEELADQQAG